MIIISDFIPIIVNRYNTMRIIFKASLCACILFISLLSTVVVHAVKPPIKIAAIFAQTGIDSLDNKSYIEGAKLTVNEINRQGGLLDRQLELIIIDNQSTPKGSEEAAKKAVKLNVSVVIGAAWSSHSLPIALILQKSKIPMITPISNDPEVTKTGDYIFRVCFDDEYQSKVLADFAYNELKARTSVILKNIEEVYSVTLSRFLKKSFLKNNGEVLWNDVYNNMAADFSHILREVQEYTPDIVFVPGYARDSGLLIKQAGKMGIKTIFLGGDGWDDQDIEDYGGKYLEGSYYATHWHWDIPSAANLRFKKIYQKKYGMNAKSRNFLLLWFMTLLDYLLTR